MKGSGCIWKAQIQRWWNSSGNLDFATAFRVLIFLVVVSIFLVGSYNFYDLIFRFMERNQPLGPVLNGKLVSVALLGCAMILLFSNIITSLSVLYLGRDMKMLFSYPLHPFQIFLPKLFTSAFVGSWTVLCLLLPLCAAFGHARQAGALFYIVGSIMIVPYVGICAGIGTTITMLLTRFMPATRSRVFIIIAFLAVSVVSVTWMRMTGMTRMTGAEALSVVDEFMYVKFGMIWYLPSYWSLQVLEGLIQEDFHRWGFYLGLLFSTASVCLLPTLWFGLDRRIYYTGWTKTQQASVRGSGDKGIFTKASRVSRDLSLGKALGWLKPSTRALMLKDFRMFCRDTTQWLQFLILLSLVGVYFFNTRNLPFDLEEYFWRNVLGFVNLAMTGFVLTTLALRFFFPMVSLEGRSFWLVGAAPVSRKKFLWAKIWPSLFISCTLGLGLISLSNRLLDVDLVMAIFSTGTVLAMAVTITCLCLGLGAMFPQFNVQSAAEIASGAGAILTMILGLIYIGGVIVLEAGPLRQMLSTQAGMEWFSHPWVKLSLVGVLVWSALFALIPLLLGTISISKRDI